MIKITPKMLSHDITDITDEFTNVKYHPIHSVFNGNSFWDNYGCIVKPLLTQSGFQTKNKKQVLETLNRNSLNLFFVPKSTLLYQTYIHYVLSHTTDDSTKELVAPNNLEEITALNNLIFSFARSVLVINRKNQEGLFFLGTYTYHKQKNAENLHFYVSFLKILFSQSNQRGVDRQIDFLNYANTVVGTPVESAHDFLKNADKTKNKQSLATEPYSKQKPDAKSKHVQSMINVVNHFDKTMGSPFSFMAQTWHAKYNAIKHLWNKTNFVTNPKYSRDKVNIMIAFLSDSVHKIYDIRFRSRF